MLDYMCLPFLFNLNLSPLSPVCDVQATFEFPAVHRLIDLTRTRTLSTEYPEWVPTLFLNHNHKDLYRGFVFLC